MASDMNAKDARNLELALRELTAELKLQRGVDPDASIADKPKRLVEGWPPPRAPLAEADIEAISEVGKSLPHENGGAVIQKPGERPWYESIDNSYLIPNTGHNSRAMEILRKSLEENNGQA